MNPPLATAHSDAKAPVREVIRIAPESVARVEWLIVLLALMLAVWVYPLRLQDAWLVALPLWMESHGPVVAWFWRAAGPLVSFYHSPLILRGVMAGPPMLALMALAAGRWLMGGVSALPAAAAGRSGGCRPVWLSVLAFVGWTLLSGLWSPTPDIARDAALWTALFGGFFFVLLRRGISAAERRQLAVWLMVLGTLVLAILYLQALPLFGGVIFKFMYLFAESDRNRLGSLIGHNTAAASFLMLTAFPALGLLLGGRSRRRRMLTAAYLCAVIFGALLLQSRSIWILGPILAALALRSGLRHVGWVGGKWVPTLLLATLALGLLTQSIHHPWNPFYQPNLTLPGRIRDLEPENLLLESRLRLNVVGVQMVKQHPWIGHGLFAFQYVYPRFQGAYFNTHPDSPLNQTANRSNMAHNEYLQVLIDQGLIGLVLLGWVIGEIVRRGWGRRRSACGADRLLREAFGWSSLGLALHALVDFPLHVPQLLLPGMVCMAAWATDRAPAGVGGGDSPTEQPAATTAFRPRVFVRLLASLLLIGVIPLLSTWMMLALQADAMLNEGAGYARAWELDQRAERRLSYEEQVHLLKSALEYERRAMVLSPANYQIYSNALDAGFYLGQVFGRQSARLANQDPAVARELHKQAIQALNQSLALGAKTLKGLNYHFVYYRLAQVYRELAWLEPGRGYEQKRLRALEQTIAYCPAYTDATYELAEAFDLSGAVDKETVLHLRRQIHKMTPERFNHYYVFPANGLKHDGFFEKAALIWEQILQVDPNDENYLAETIDCQLLAGNTGRARELSDHFRRVNWQGYLNTSTLIIDALVGKDWHQAMSYIVNVHTQEPQYRARYRAIELEARRREGTTAVLVVTPASGVSSEDWNRLVAEWRPEVLLAYLQEPTAARQAFDERLALAGPDPPLRFWLEGVRLGLAQGDESFARRNLARALPLLSEPSAIARCQSTWPRLYAAVAAETNP